MGSSSGHGLACRPLGAWGPTNVSPRASVRSAPTAQQLLVGIPGAPRLAATLAHRMRPLGWVHGRSPCRISRRRCGRRSAVCSTGWTPSNAVPVVFPYDGDLHKRWTYFPGQRPGLRLGDLSDEQLDPALDLLQLVHSVRGSCDTRSW